MSDVLADIRKFIAEAEAQKQGSGAPAFQLTLPGARDLITAYDLLCGTVGAVSFGPNFSDVRRQVARRGDEPPSPRSGDA